MTWYYNGNPFTAEDAGEAIGFVYVITNLKDGRKYIGQKKLHFKRTKKPLKGKKRRRVSVIDSDWQDYWGSNKELWADVGKLGKENFRREILYLCKRKVEMNYLELREQINRDVLLKPKEYYNEYCGGRISRKQMGSLHILP